MDPALQGEEAEQVASEQDAVRDFDRDVGAVRRGASLVPVSEGCRELT